MSLRDQFKKANLISDKKARQLAHQARVERKEKGREQLEGEEEARTDEVRDLQAKDRANTRREQAEAERQRKLREEEIAVDVLLESAKKPGPGTVKFYFATADGALPWLELSPREAQEVTAGQLIVVRSGPASTHTYRLLPTDAGKRVHNVRPEAVVFAPRGVLPH